MIYDCATAIARGRVRGGRVAVSADFSVGASMGFAVLCATSPGVFGAGGVGLGIAGAAQDGRCRVVVTELFSELKLQASDRVALERDFPSIVAVGAAGAADQAGLRLGGPGGQDEALALNLMVVALFDDRLHFAGSGGGMLIHARRGDVRRLHPPPAAARAAPPGEAPALRLSGEAPALSMPGEAPALRISGGAMALAPGDTLLAVSRRIMPAEERRAQILVARGRGRTADEVAMALLDAFVRLSDPATGETALCVLKLR